MATPEQIERELRAVHNFEKLGEGVELVADDIHLDTDDHGCETSQAVIRIDGELWAMDAYCHPYDGVQETYDPYRVEAVEVVTIEYRQVIT